MTRHTLTAFDTEISYISEGECDAAPVLLLHPIGLDHTVWSDVAAALPSYRVIRPDMRGHGASQAALGPYPMRELVMEAAAVLTHASAMGAVVVGAGIGGVIAQGLAAERPDLVRAMVLIGTAAKLATPAHWSQRTADMRTHGIIARAPDMARLWGRAELADRLCVTDTEAYAGCYEALADTDLRASTAALRLSTLGLCGTNDRVTPPDLMRELIDTIPGSRFALIRRAGHAAMLDAPQAVAAEITIFLDAIGHAAPAP